MVKYRILVVDDEAMQRGLIAEILGSAKDHFDILEASNGIEAIAMLDEHTFDAVLLDKRMPLMDGDELCRQIRARPELSLLPLLMITGTNTTEELALSYEAGVSDFIRKPYNSIELISRLTGAVYKKRLVDQLDTAEALLFSLARMVEAKDQTTGDHCSRLMHMGMTFGRVLGLPDDDLDALRKGGVVHDIGKLGIPDSILLKKGPLNDDEWRLMRTHTVIGAQLCQGLSSMRSVTPIIRHHHERWDGSGYPDGLAGEEIPLLARVFQILDVYDALASARPYKRAMSLDEIINIFAAETARGWRDPSLVRVFLDMLKSNPEKLFIHQFRPQTEDEKIFQSIAATGVMDWDRERERGTEAHGEAGF